MKNMLSKLFIISLIISFAASSLSAAPDDRKTIKRVIVEGYIKGIITEGDAGKVAENWHKSCDIVIKKQEGIHKLPASYWYNRLKQKPGPIIKDVKYEFQTIHITGYAAIAVIKVYYRDKPKYMDYISLYKFSDGWKIATKVYYEYRK